MEFAQAQSKQYELSFNTKSRKNVMEIFVEKLKKHEVWLIWVDFYHFGAKMNFYEKLGSNFYGLSATIRKIIEKVGSYWRQPQTDRWTDRWTEKQPLHLKRGQNFQNLEAPSFGPNQPSLAMFNSNDSSICFCWSLSA